MLRRRLGRTDLEVSIIGLGGLPLQWRPREEAIAVVRRAIELGVNFIATARSYGDSEDKIGEAIRGIDHPLFIATESHLRTRRGVKEHLKESLRRLGRSKVGLFFLHSVDSEAELGKCLDRGGALEAVEEAREEGKVDYIGVSGHYNEVLATALKTGRFDVVLATYNLRITSADEELFPLAQNLDIGVVVMKPLGGGTLAIPPEAVRFGAEDKAVSSAEVALRFVLANPRVHAAIPGMGTIREVEADVPLGYALPEMGAREAGELQEKAASALYSLCQSCGYCLPYCPEGIDIREIFRLRVFHEQYGMIDYARSSYEKYREKVKLCIECQACLKRCPAGLDIPALLKRVDALLEGS